MLVREYEVGRKPLSGLPVRLLGSDAPLQSCARRDDASCILFFFSQDAGRSTSPISRPPHPHGALMVSCPPSPIFIRRCPQVREHVASHHAERPVGYFALRQGWRRRFHTAWMLSLQCTHVYFMRGRECKLHFSHHVVYIFLFPWMEACNEDPGRL